MQVQHSASLKGQAKCVGTSDEDRRLRQQSQPAQAPPNNATSYGHLGLLDDFDRLGGSVTCNQVLWDGGAGGAPVAAGEGHRWLLLRHGQTNFNADGRVQGSSDIARLSDEGRRQAASVGAFLATLHIDKVYVSPLARAQETLDEVDKVIADLRRPGDEGLAPALPEGFDEGKAGRATLGLGGNMTHILQVAKMMTLTRTGLVH